MTAKKPPGKLNLAELIADEEANFQRGPKCGVVNALEELREKHGDEFAKQFAAAVVDSGIKATSIEKALGKLDIRLVADRITRHRRKECSCDKR